MSRQEWCSHGLPGEQLFAKPAEVMAQARELLAATLMPCLQRDVQIGKALHHTASICITYSMI